MQDQIYQPKRREHFPALSLPVVSAKFCSVALLPQKPSGLGLLWTVNQDSTTSTFTQLLSSEFQLKWPWTYICKSLKAWHYANWHYHVTCGAYAIGCNSSSCTAPLPGHSKKAVSALTHKSWRGNLGFPMWWCCQVNHKHGFTIHTTA